MRVGDSSLTTVWLTTTTVIDDRSRLSVMSIAMYLPAMTRDLLAVTNTDEHTVLFSDQQPYDDSVLIADTVVDSTASKLAKTQSGKRMQMNSSRLPPSSPLPLPPSSPLMPLPSLIAAENQLNYVSSKSSSIGPNMGVCMSSGIWFHATEQCSEALPSAWKRIVSNYMCIEKVESWLTWWSNSGVHRPQNAGKLQYTKGLVTQASMLAEVHGTIWHENILCERRG